LDVVPVPDAATWTHPPFAGVRAADPDTGAECVWGRGAIDDKHSVVALCAAVEALLQAGFVPAVPYIALIFGHDEELGGVSGAAACTEALPALLRACLGARPLPQPAFSFLLDEGLFLISDFAGQGNHGPVAVICVGEKGHLNVELSVEGPAGHSSVPGPSTTIGTLARAITKLEAAPFPSHLYPASALLTALLPGLQSALARVAISHMWLTGGALKHVMAWASPATAAMVRTTTAVTMTAGGLKSNVLPPRATALVNHRIHPAESVASVIARDTTVINDSRVKLRPFEGLEPSPVSRADASAPGWRAITASLASIFPAATPAPGLMLGNTDTRYYWALARDIYRHCPTELSMAGTKLFHGRDERITVPNLARISAFYAAVIVEGAGAHSSP
jgi:carboxypeptidase PM20D1